MTFTLNFSKTAPGRVEALILFLGADRKLGRGGG